MELVNEMSILQQNKNTFNKIMAGLKKYKSEMDGNAQKSISVRLDKEKYFNAVFQVLVKYELDNIVMETNGDRTYFCAKVSGYVSGVSSNSYYGYRNSQIQEDVALAYIQRVQKNHDSSWRRDEHAEELLEYAGVNMYSSEQEIKRSQAYHTLNSAVSELMSSKIDVVLKDKVHVRLKTRRNMIPLIIYSESNNELDYPHEGLYGSGLMATSCRTKDWLDSIVAKGSINNMCSLAMRYTPYNQWTLLDFSHLDCVDKNAMQLKYQN